MRGPRTLFAEPRGLHVVTVSAKDNGGPAIHSGRDVLALASAYHVPSCPPSHAVTTQVWLPYSRTRAKASCSHSPHTRLERRGGAGGR